jgi:hypothetical protein
VSQLTPSHFIQERKKDKETNKCETKERERHGEKKKRGEK